MVVCPPGVLSNPGQLLGACTTQLAPDTPAAEEGWPGACCRNDVLCIQCFRN